jgi:hypothetical protein
MKTTRNRLYRMAVRATSKTLTEVRLLCYKQAYCDTKGVGCMSKLPPASTICGRCGCIIMYTGDNCIFCPPAHEMLRDVGDSLGVSENAYCIIDVDQTGDCNIFAVEAPITTIPLIRICDHTITGLPDESTVHDELLRLLVHPCYYDSQMRGEENSTSGEMD